MHIISRKTLLAFAALYPEASKPLDGWYRIFKKTDFENLNQVRIFYPHADLVSRKDGEFTIFLLTRQHLAGCSRFNIGGNKYRLITHIIYDWNKVFIRAVLTHPEYDRWSNP
jgi:mRNA interferase HigB